MSSGPIPLLKPGDLQYVPIATDFQTILAQDLGNLGTDQDGFDELFNEAAALAGESEGALEAMDSDLNDAGIALPAFDNTDAADIAAQLQPASDATDTALSNYDSTLASATTTCTTGQPGCGTISVPAPNSQMLGTPNPANPTPDFTQPCNTTQYIGTYQKDTGSVDVVIRKENLPYDYSLGNITAAQMHGAPIDNPRLNLLNDTFDYQPPGQMVVQIVIDTSVAGTVNATLAMQFDNLPAWYYYCFNFTVA